MNCPKCNNILKQGKTKNSDVTVDYCSKCKGIWFDEKELEQVEYESVKFLAVPPDAIESKYQCPKCQKALFSFSYPQTFVTIDMCKKCKGLWVDAGELKEIKAVRKKLKQQGTAKQQDKIYGAKGKLIGFIESAIDNILDGL